MNGTEEGEENFSSLAKKLLERRNSTFKKLLGRCIQLEKEAVLKKQTEEEFAEKLVMANRIIKALRLEALALQDVTNSRETETLRLQGLLESEEASESDQGAPQHDT